MRTHKPIVYRAHSRDIEEQSVDNSVVISCPSNDPIIQFLRMIMGQSRENNGYSVSIQGGGSVNNSLSRLEGFSYFDIKYSYLLKSIIKLKLTKEGKFASRCSLYNHIEAYFPDKQ